MYTIGSLFAGIGGFDLGFERAGFKTVWQVEKNAYCRRVLRRHFPDADRRVTDVRFAGARNLHTVDVVTGGFPCQDVSHAGPRVGIDGARSGLWREMRRIICELRPRFVLVENTSGLLDRGMERVLGEMAEDGFDAEWTVFSACTFGAPHTRERVFILAYPASERPRQLRWSECATQGPADWRVCWPEPKPAVSRVAYGVSDRLDRLTSLGNAVVPQIPELIARRLKAVIGGE